MTDNELDLIKEQNFLLKDILKWVRFLGSVKLKDALTQILNDDSLRLAYQLSDGINTSMSISKSTGIRQPRVSELWREWAALGMGETLAVSGGGRFRRSFDLKLMGITFPEKRKDDIKNGNSEQLHTETENKSLETS